MLKKKKVDIKNLYEEFDEFSLENYLIHFRKGREKDHQKGKINRNAIVKRAQHV